MKAILLSMMIQAAIAPGAEVPNVSAKNQDGKVIRVTDLKGEPVVLFFYPKDDTPGCTKQACSLRDQYGDLQKAGIVVLGVSRQDAESHNAFREKYHLPFDLLTDEDGSFAKAFGVETIPVVGYFKRQSVLIGADGKVVKFMNNVDPSTHTQQVLDALKK